MSEECQFCGETFEDDDRLHVHWGDEHEEELNSHQKDTYRSARKKIEQREEARREQRKANVRRYAGYAVFAVLFIGIGGLIVGQLQVSTTKSTGEASFNLTGQPMIGEDDAPVTVLEFSDYQCPHCKRFHENVLPRIEDEYVEEGDVKVYSLNHAFLGRLSEEAALGAECVYEQNEDAFHEYSDEIYGRQAVLDSEDVTEVATDVVNDTDSVRQCITNNGQISDVRQDLQQGSDNGVEGTPTIFVDGQKLDSYDYGTVSAAIDARLDE